MALEILDPTGYYWNFRSIVVNLRRLDGACEIFQRRSVIFLNQINKKKQRVTMQSRKTSSPAANRSGSRSNGSSRSSSKLDPTGMYKKPSQQQVKCHYLDPTGLYWEVRRGEAAGVTHPRAAHPTNVNCDLVLGTNHGFGFDSDSGEEQRHECTHERWLSCGFSGWGSVAARKRPAVDGEESDEFRRQTADDGGRSRMLCLTGMPENII